MAPKKKVDSDDLDDGNDDSDFIADSEEEEKPKKRKAPAKAPAKKSAKKPAAKVKSEDDEDDGSEDEKPKKKKTPAKPKVVNKKFTQPEQLDDGFTAHPPSLLYKQFGTPVHSEKIAAFDLDGTLINSLSGNTFAESSDDWYTYNDNVAVKLKQYHDEGYKIVIFTNQGGIKGALAGAASEKIRGKVTKFLATMHVPALVMMATNLTDEWRKPDIGMWKFMCSNLNGGVAPDLSKSFFVGDNHNNADEGFAANAGLKYRSESEEFGPPGPKPNQGGDGPNAGLVQAFLTLAEEAKNSGKDSAVFAARTYNKVAGILKAFPKKIVDTPACLKEVNALAGVGKGSMSVIKDYLKDGCLKPKEIPAERMGAAATGGKEREQAMQFM